MSTVPVLREIVPAYKVAVLISTGSFWSVFAGLGAVQYKRGEVTVPRPYCGPLATFGDLDSANRWSTGLCRVLTLQVLPVMIYQSEQTGLWEQDGEVFWKGGLPTGTVLAEAVGVL